MTMAAAVAQSRVVFDLCANDEAFSWLREVNPVLLTDKQPDNQGRCDLL